VYDTSSSMCFSNWLTDMAGEFQATICVDTKVFGSFLLGYCIFAQMKR